MNNKGIYSIITTFFLVATMVLVAIGLLYFNYTTSAQEKAMFEGTEPFEKASDIKDSIMGCYGSMNMDKLLDANLAKRCGKKFMDANAPILKGFTLESLKFLSCEQKQTRIGTDNDCKQRFVYYINIDKNYSTCLGRITICSAI